MSLLSLWTVYHWSSSGLKTAKLSGSVKFFALLTVTSIGGMTWLPIS